MKVAIVFLLCALVACSHAAPLVMSPDTDMGNEIMVGMIKFMFNQTGCVATCDKSVCPNEAKPATETNLRQCVDCVLNCSPETKCLMNYGKWTQQQLSEGISGLMCAIYLDGCRLGQTTMDCPRPNISAFMGMKPPKFPAGTCIDPSAMPAPPMSQTDKAKMCEHMSCGNKKILAAPACKRGADALTAIYQMSGAWMHC